MLFEQYHFIKHNIQYYIFINIKQTTLFYQATKNNNIHFLNIVFLQYALNFITKFK